ncbi:MAG: glycoside hydrolase family 75 protein [Sandaracinus sp.]
MRVFASIVLTISVAGPLALGCAAPRARSTEDAATDPDRDAGAAAMDAATEDDAPIDDAAPADDAARPADATAQTDATWGPCSYAGIMGVCESTSLCPAGHMPRMGLCPGPADIQCCLPDVDGGMPGTLTPAEVLASLGACNRIGGDYGLDAGDPETVPVCQTANVIWWQADMDIDCDGGQSALCMSDPDYMPDTSGVDSHGNALDASTLPFIVIPLPSARFRYADHGIRIGQVAVVLYQDRMAYGIFGDAGPSSGIGEASFAMAEALGIPSNPRTGGVDSGVTYLVFTDAGARVTHNEDHAEAVSIGSAMLDAFVNR